MTTRDPWEGLRKMTAARIAQGRAGGSLPTGELLKFELDHARARDAVRKPFDAAGMLRDARAATGLEGLIVPTLARDRSEYLRRPDLGRTMGPEAVRELAARRGDFDVALMVSDGLSALAAHRHGPELLGLLAAGLRRRGRKVSGVVVVPFGRVAVEDVVGHALGARLSVMLIGERPGLLSADSLGVYLVYGPDPGKKTDADRNCVSNIRPEGLPVAAGAETVLYLVEAALGRGLTGVGLKDERGVEPGREKLEGRS